MRLFILALVAGCASRPTHAPPPDLLPPENGLHLEIHASWKTPVGATMEGAWVVGAPGSVKDGVIETNPVLSDDGRSFYPLIALDIHGGTARTWDGHRDGTAIVRVYGDELDLTFDRDDPSDRWVHQLSRKEGAVTIDGGDDPRVHRYPDFASARAAVDEDVLAQDPVRLMARLGGKPGDSSTVAGLIATHVARPRAIDGRRVTVHGVIVDVWNDGIAIAPPGVVTPTVSCSIPDAERRFRLFQTVAASGIVTDDIGLRMTFRGIAYRGDATGVSLDECRAR